MVTHVQWEPLENSGVLRKWKWPGSVHYPVLLGLDRHSSASQRNPARTRLVEWVRLPAKGDIHPWEGRDEDSQLQVPEVML